MARIDVPTLQCDRCGHTTQDLNEMAAFQTLNRDTVSGREKWDFCPKCWSRWLEFLSSGANETPDA